MGKKVKKKTKVGQKEKRVSSASPRTVLQRSNEGTIGSPDENKIEKESLDDKVSVVRERSICTHIDKGVDLAKLSSKVQLSIPVRCEDCREGAADRRVNKGKGKHVKKRGGGSGDSRSGSAAIWICLGCGHFSCGGIGFPTTPQSHAVRHARQSRHPLAVQFENPQLRWCFPCNTLIPIEKTDENVDPKDTLQGIIKMIKQQSSEGGAPRDVEDTWFGSGSLTRDINQDYQVSSMPDGSGGYVVRGLLNLGNTCFFNSVTQNLLAISKIRDYFLNLGECAGPLTGALKKLFVETVSDSGVRNVINPKSLFACFCAKFPQFRGYQQHDSHELLRCMLDGWCTEELNAKKRSEYVKECKNSSNSALTFVDAVFGGQLSSTVTCLECGHSSIVYEPFLDLSLPVPTKKPPPKKTQAGSRASKPKLPPKRTSKVHQKVRRCANPSVSLACSNHQSTSAKISCESKSNTTVAGKTVISFGDSTSSASNNMNFMDGDKNSAVQNMPTTKETEKVQYLEKFAESDFTWMDYCVIPDDNNLNSKTCDISLIPDSESMNETENYVLPHDSDNYTEEIPTSCLEETTSSLGTLSSPVDNNLVVENSTTNKVVYGDLVSINDLECASQTSPKEHKISVDYSVKPVEEEAPLQVKDSEVLLLQETSTSGETHMERSEIPTSAVSCEQESLEYDGFSDLFNEPEDDAQNPSSSNNNSEAKEIVEARFTAENSSESDQDVIDDSNSPVSVDACLAYFTKSELLSKSEHAWQCENCSKALQQQRIRSRKKAMQPVLRVLNNGNSDRTEVSFPDPDKNCAAIDKLEHLRNGSSKGDITRISEENFISHEEEVCPKQNSTLESIEINEPNSSIFMSEDGIIEMQDSLETSSSNQTDKTSYSCTGGEPGIAECTDSIQMMEPKQFTDGCHSAHSINEDVDSGDKDLDCESLKVKRDATKQIVLTRAPPILTIHLKRFGHDARGRLSKLTGHVDFRETIDLKPYMELRSTYQNTHKYQLSGVVEHLGSMKQGHYVAYVRGDTRSDGKTTQESGNSVWYYASDSHVRQASSKEVLGCEAYILFYERI